VLAGVDKRQLALERELAYERQLAFLTNTNAQSATASASPASPSGTHMKYHDFGGMLSDCHFFQIPPFS